MFTHCYSHSLNLAANDSVKKSKYMKASLEIASEITKLIKLSPRRDAIFKELKSEHDLMTESKSPAICLLCPTRWTVRADSMLSILKNYQVLLDTWDEAVDVVRDVETKSRIRGVSFQMSSFDFLFGTMLSEMVLRHTDNLSRTLQKKTCSASEGQQIARLVVDTLLTMRNDESFDLFWQKLTLFSQPLDIEPCLPRRRKIPRRLDSGSAESYYTKLQNPILSRIILKELILQ